MTTPIELDFMMGPGVSLTGEIMWDQQQYNKGNQRQSIKLSLLLSEEEIVPTSSKMLGGHDAHSKDMMERLKVSLGEIESQKENDAERLR